jgi:aspartyl-tRNA(Asn)/glutamyl-tRNA(Gln) amidotransferase subunit A
LSESGRYGLRVEGEELMSMYGKTRDQGFGAEVKRRILMGTYALSAGYYDAFYKRAQQVKQQAAASCGKYIALQTV